MWHDFRKFIARGNVLDMAVGIIIGAAFTTVVKSLVDDVIMPPIGRLTGGMDFSNLFVNLSGGTYGSLADAKAAGAATINYGIFLNNTIAFLIVAFVVFLIVRSYTRLLERMSREEVEEAAPVPEPTLCPHCRFEIPAGATRCGHCTAQLAGAV
ncbi:MAG: large conductance mechanosensitive channel protein MscL [Gemmatimonadota bacterium]|jgi:large conductance mechanosensitive channel